MPDVFSYAKNFSVGFAIPYTLGGQTRQYYPDYLVKIDDGHGVDDLLNLVLEVTGSKKADKEAKVDTAKSLWVPAVNNECRFGRWAFIEIRDPWSAQREIRELIANQAEPSKVA